MTVEVPVEVSARGCVLDTSPEAFGELRRSDDALDDVAELRSRLHVDGYLFLPGYLDRAEVLAARGELLGLIAEVGGTMPGTDPQAATPPPEPLKGTLGVFAPRSPLLQDLLYRGRMIQLYERVFGEPVRHFDYTWLRAIPPGPASRPHMDAVFMNRGTLNLLTAWTPLGDIDRKLGGLAILEGSHLLEDITNDYGRRDVDQFCRNRDEDQPLATKDGPAWDGALAHDPEQLRKDLGLRWLTTDYRAGDLLTFTIFTAHVGLDNHSDQLRLSSDTRYQRASEPADPRWVGIDPSRHSARSKRGTIC